MHLKELISHDFERIISRKRSPYSDGRAKGYERSFDFLLFSAFPSEEDLLEIRARIAVYCKGGTMASELQGKHPRFIEGYRKSFRNVYHTAGFMVQDPMASYSEISQGQWKLIGLLTDRGAPDFTGLTKEEANIWIKENENGKEDR